MIEFLLVRHAKSSWDYPQLKDIDRPLNKRGKRDAPFMANYCHNKGIGVSHLFSSPAVRAYNTALQFQEEFAIEEISVESDLYFGDESDWMHIINNLESDVKLPAFFSHNPTITYFANAFTGDFIDNVPTCGIIHLKSECQEWSEVDYNNTVIIGVYFPKKVRP